MKNLGKDCNCLPSHNPGATLTATSTGEIVSIAGIYGTGLVIAHMGAVAAADATNYFTFSLTESATTGGSYTANTTLAGVGGADLLINSTAEANTVKLMTFTPSRTKDWVKVVATETGTASAIISSEVMFEVSKKPANT